MIPEGIEAHPPTLRYFLAQQMDDRAERTCSSLRCTLLERGGTVYKESQERRENYI